MVIFGAAGDLTKRLLVPALYNLATTKLLPEYFELIGVDLADLDANSWRDSLHKMMESFVGHAASESRIDKVDEDTWQRLTGHIAYIKGDLNDDGLYGKLKQHLDQESGTRAIVCSIWPSLIDFSVQWSLTSARQGCSRRTGIRMARSRSAGATW